MAPRSDGHGVERRFCALQVFGTRVRLRRRPMDNQGRDRRRRAGAGAEHRTLRAIFLAWRGRLPEQAAIGDALPVWRSFGKASWKIVILLGQRLRPTA